ESPAILRDPARAGAGARSERRGREKPPDRPDRGPLRPFRSVPGPWNRHRAPVLEGRRRSSPRRLARPLRPDVADRRGYAMGLARWSHGDHGAQHEGISQSMKLNILSRSSMAGWILIAACGAGCVSSKGYQTAMSEKD